MIYVVTKKDEFDDIANRENEYNWSQVDNISCIAPYIDFIAYHIQWNLQYTTFRYKTPPIIRPHIIKQKGVYHAKNYI